MNINAFDLNLLKVFEALYEERNVTRAGQRIGLAQSSMSNALNRLRYVFKDELFVRTPKEMRPSPRAVELAPQIQSILENARLMVGAAVPFDPQTSQGTARIASSDNLKILLTPSLVEYAAQHAPSISLRMRSLDKERIYDDLDEERVALAIGTFGEVPKRMQVEDLFNDSFVCLARKGHTKLRRGLSLRRFAEIPHVLVTLRDDESGVVDDMLAAKGLRRQVAVTVDQFSVLPHLIAATDYLAMCPRSIAGIITRNVDCAIYQPPIALPEWPVQTLRLRKHVADPLVDWVVDAIRISRS